MPSSPSPLVGRAEEVQALRTLITCARNGAGGALVISGDPGIGKTALLDAATNGLAGVTVIRSDGFESELALPFAGLQRVTSALADHVAALPDRQRQALRVACGADEGPTPDRFLVGLGLLDLFARAGDTQPVVCVIDDAHWLDAESRDVLAFVARRLEAESAVLLFGARDTDEAVTALAGIPRTRLTGLDTSSAVRLLASAAPEVIDPHAAARLADATGGNPLALIDLARDLSARRLSEFSLSTDPVPISRRLEVHYLSRVRDMSDDVQTWLLLAAAEPTGHAELIAAAAAELGLPADCAAAAERAGLVATDTHVVFRHPLVRSAVYGAATGIPRRRVQSALAHQATRLGLSELAAWHAAESSPGIDPDVADRLQAVAETARRRGGLVSHANLLSRAAALTPPGPARNERLLSAAEAAAEVGAVTLASQLLERVPADKLDGIGRGRLISTRCALALFVADPPGVLSAPAAMLSAANEFHGLSPEREQRALLAAFEYALATELLMEGTTLDELGRRMAAGAELLDGPRGIVLRALSAHALAPYDEAVPLVRRALDTLFALDDDQLAEFGFTGIALTTALFDADAGDGYLSRLAHVASEAGALRALDTVLWVRSTFEIGRGDPAAAGRYLEQVRELRRAIGYSAENVVNVAYLSWAGTSRADVEVFATAAHSMGFGGVETFARAAMSAIDIADGNYAAAHQLLGQMIASPFLQVTYLHLANYVEAAARSGHDADAAETGRRITAMAQASATPWIRGLDQRCQALLATDIHAEEHYRTAIQLLGTAGVPVDLGRAHLLYGEWLRRMRRRRDAREQLRTAVEIFDRIEAPAFAQRARTELAATGERMSERRVVAGVEMSPREEAVARLAAAGNTNAEVAATLFISTNTVDYHLRKVFGKLGVSSRRQLGERFTGAG